MKRCIPGKIFTFILLMACGSVLLAQSSISAHLGINGTWITNSSPNNYAMRPGFSLGLTASRKVIPQVLDLSLETGISNENTEGKIEIAISESLHGINLDYWNSAFISNLHLIDGLVVQAGLQYSYLILARNDFTREDVVNGSNVVTYTFDQNNWSLLVGLEKRILFQLDLGFRYSHGLNDISSSYQHITMYNAMPPENFLKHVRSCQIYLRKGLFVK